MAYKIEDFAMMAPMRYYNNEAASQKRTDMIEDKDDLYVASEKHDGDWGMFIHYSKGNNLIRSRSISKVTGVYGDYTAKLPHLCEEMDNWPDNTVVLAEICWDEYGTNANTVGTILRCLPSKAVERQKDKKLSGLIFDLLMFAGEDLTSTPYIDRLEKIDAEFNPTHISDMNYHYFKPTQVFFTDFAAAADNIISRGGEGIVIQRKDNPYMPGTRTAWKTLKLKKSLPEMELKIVATIDPKMHYEGDCPDITWEYWYQDMPNANSQAGDFPVTKPFFYGWKNGITVEYNGTTCDVTSGLTDNDREWLATDEAQQMIKNGELYAVVKAMQTNSLGRLRHPYVVRLRNDM